MTDRALALRVAIVDNSIDPSLYRPVEHWNRYLPVEADAFIAREGRFPDPRAYSHLILTGSEASILERAPWVEDEAGIVREAVRRGVSVLGSCWGHQLLAYALGGPGHVRRCARPEIGWVPVRVTRGDDLLGPPGEFFTFSVHYDEVCGLPGDFEVLASSESCPVQAFRVRGKSVWGLQCHPEVDIVTGLRFLEDLVERGFKGRDALLEALASRPRDSRAVFRIVEAFLARPFRAEGTR
jgi:GMP synthase-like glutamine amidotransferase